MGFVPQVDPQKALRRTQRALVESRDKHQKVLEQKAEGLGERIGTAPVDEVALCNSLAPLLQRRKLASARTAKDLAARLTTLKQEVEYDPAAKTLSALKAVKKAVEVLKPDELVGDTLLQLYDVAVPFKEREEELQ